MSSATYAGNHERLGDLFEFQNGRGFKKSEWSQQGLPIIRIQNLNDPDASFNRFNGTYSEDILVSAGDLLFSWSGTVGSSFGPHIWQGEQGVLNQHIFKVLSKKDIDVRYAFYALEQITQDIEKEVSGSVGLVHITKKRLNEFTIPVPPLPEQRRIVAILDEAFDELATATANAKRTWRIARQIFEQEVDEAFDRLSCTSPLVELKDVLKSQPRNGWSPPAACHAESGVPVLTLSSVTGFRFRPEKVKHTSAQTDPHKHYWVNNGDLLITRSNTPSLVGHVAVADGLHLPTIYPDLIMRMKVDVKRALTRFIYYQLRSSRIRSIICSSAKGASATMIKISKSTVQDLPIFCPSMSEQSPIADRLSQLEVAADRFEELLVRKAVALDKLKSSLLHAAFAGKL